MTQALEIFFQLPPSGGGACFLNLIDFLSCLMQSTFVDDSVSVEHAREYGHTHLFEVCSCLLQNSPLMHTTRVKLQYSSQALALFPEVGSPTLALSQYTMFLQILSLSEKFQNKAIVLIHFSARYEEQARISW